MGVIDFNHTNATKTAHTVTESNLEHTADFPQKEIPSPHLGLLNLLGDLNSSRLCHQSRALNQNHSSW